MHLTSKYEALKGKIQASESARNLSVLEAKIRSYGQTIFHLQDFVETKSRETNYKFLKESTFTLLSNMNRNAKTAAVSGSWFGLKCCSCSWMSINCFCSCCTDSVLINLLQHCWIWTYFYQHDTRRRISTNFFRCSKIESGWTWNCPISGADSNLGRGGHPRCHYSGGDFRDGGPNRHGHLHGHWGQLVVEGPGYTPFSLLGAAPGLRRFETYKLASGFVEHQSSPWQKVWSIRFAERNVEFLAVKRAAAVPVTECQYALLRQSLSPLCA